MPNFSASIKEKYTTIPSDEILQKTARALGLNGIETFVVSSKEEAKQKLFELLPEGAEIMNNTSVTMDQIGATEEIMNSGRYNAVRHKLNDPETSLKEKAILGATADWTTGSVHVITQDGHLLIASNTGSQLGSEVYASPNVIFVAGANKVVEDFESGLKRITNTLCFWNQSAPIKLTTPRLDHLCPNCWS